MKKILIVCILLLIVVIAGSSNSPTGNAVRDSEDSAGYAKPSKAQPFPAMTGTGHEQTCN